MSGGDDRRDGERGERGADDALWALLDAGALPALDDDAVDGALARVRAVIDDDDHAASARAASARAASARAAGAGDDAPCPDALREGLAARDDLIDAETLWRLLGAAEVAPPSADALGRARAAVHAELDAGDAAPSVSWWQLALPHVAVAVGFVALALAIGAPMKAGNWAAAIGLGGAAALLATFVVPYAKIVLALVAVVSVGAMVILARGDGGGLEAIPWCGVLEMGAAVLPLSITAAMLLRRPWARARGGDARDAGRGAAATTLAAATAAGAMAGQAVLILACPGRELSHLLVGHAGGVALAAGIGYAIGMLPVFRRVRATA